MKQFFAIVTALLLSIPLAAQVRQTPVGSAPPKGESDYRFCPPGSGERGFAAGLLGGLRNGSGYDPAARRHQSGADLTHLKRCGFARTEVE